MAKDRSLDDFASSGTDGSETEAEADPDGSETEAEADPSESDPTVVDLAESTSTWTAEGAACERCGVTVTRRWHDGGDVVCSECKEW